MLIENIDKNLHLATPTDRMCAFIIDIFLMTPISILLLSPFKKYILFSYIKHHFNEMILAQIAIILSFWILGILFYTFFTLIWQATPGMKIIRLRIIPMWNNNKLTLKQAILRSIFWWSETIFFFGLPHFAVFTNTYRRVLHDKASDTIVISQNNSYSYSPDNQEKKNISWIYYIYLTFIIFYLSSYLFNLINENNKIKKAQQIQITKANNTSCINNIININNINNTKNNSFLKEYSIELLFFPLKKTDQQCLIKKTDQILWRKHDYPRAYFFKGYNQIKEKKIFNEYKDYICRKLSSNKLCFISKILQIKNANNSKTIIPDNLIKEITNINNHNNEDEIDDLLIKIWLSFILAPEKLPEIEILFNKRKATQISFIEFLNYFKKWDKNNNILSYIQNKYSNNKNKNNIKEHVISKNKSEAI